MIEADMTARLGQFELTAHLSDAGFIALLGVNGSGKTTLLKTIAGIIKTSSGHVMVRGVDVTTLPMERRGVVIVTPSSCITHLRVDDHLRWGARVKGRRVSDQRLQDVRTRLGIADGGARVGSLSLGNRERVALATALLSLPHAILVDEAFSNLHERRQFIEIFRGLTDEAGIDVVFSTQDDSDLSMAAHGYLIVDGKTERKF